MMEPDEVTLAEILKAAGYTTGIFGKWHLGDCYPQRPMDQGFDESLVHRGGGLAQPSEPIENRGRYTDPILIHNGEEVQASGYCTDVYFQAASKFIRSAVQDQQPFFIYLPTNAPHGPFHDVPEELYEKYKQLDLSPVLLGDASSADRVARIFAMIENIDQNIGRLATLLKKQDIEENTIVLLMFDNGPNTRRFVGPMRGMKSEVHDGGIRSPFYVKWPAKLKAGHTSDRIAAYIDVMPTLLDAAGIPVPNSVDGRSLLPLLQNRSVDWPERTLFLQVHRGDTPVLFHQFAARDQRWKLVRQSGFGRNTPPEDTPFELYDMRNDPREQNNLIESRPEIAARLKSAYEQWFRNVSSTRPDNYAPPRIVVGTDAETRTVLTLQDWRIENEQGWGRYGRWLLDFDGAHDYRVEFLWPQPVEPGTLDLAVGGVHASIDVTEKTDKVVLDRITIPSGEADLQALLKHGEEDTDPYHIILNRIPATPAEKENTNHAE
jgi:arylsulfatase/arylsulfatase A